MRYCYDKCLKDVKQKNENSHLKTKAHKEIEKYKYITLSLKNVDIKDGDEILYLYMKDHNKKFNHYLMKGEFKLVFNNNHDCIYGMTGMIDNRTFISWSTYLRKAIHNLKEEGYQFSHIAEMDITTLAQKLDMTYDFYLKHNMPAFEWKLNAIFTKDKRPLNHFPQNWWHPINFKFECYRNNII